MMEKEYKGARQAYESYNLNNEYGLEKEILKYIKERISENEKEIEKILEIYKSEYEYKDIEEVVEEEIEGVIEYKRQINIKKREDGFVVGKYKVSIGVIGVECYDTLECIKYMIRAIKTRNAIIISDIEYEEKGEKGLILLIIQEALKKYGINEELIQIVPYEECDYRKCDKVIYTYEKKKNIEKEEIEKLYIYIEEESLRKEAEEEYEIERKKGKEVEKLDGKIDEAIEKINKTINKGAVIYTKDPQIGYKFINMVSSKNVFVNATLQNVEEIEKSEDELLMNKRIMYEFKDLVK